MARRGVAKREGLTDSNPHGDATDLQFEDNDRLHVSARWRKGDADHMLGEFVRVTKPGAKSAALPATDIPRW